jgi:hypothetical protein
MKTFNCGQADLGQLFQRVYYHEESLEQSIHGYRYVSYVTFYGSFCILERSTTSSNLYMFCHRNPLSNYNHRIKSERERKNGNTEAHIISRNGLRHEKLIPNLSSLPKSSLLAAFRLIVVTTSFSHRLSKTSHIFF